MSKQPKRGEGPFILENSDGCSALSIPYRFVTKLIFGEERKLTFLKYCIQHDERYWNGGTHAQRRYADYDLFYGVRSMAKLEGCKWYWKCFYNTIAVVMLVVCRVMGSPNLPTPFRWAWGEPFTGKYQYTYFDRATQNQTVATEKEAEIVMNIVESDHIPEINTVTEAVAVVKS